MARDSKGVLGIGALYFEREILMEFESSKLVANRFPLDMLERIGSRIYDDFRSGAISFEVCDASLDTLTELTDGETFFAIPEPCKHCGSFEHFSSEHFIE
jgi:hypothetical protein